VKVEIWDPKERWDTEVTEDAEDSEDAQDLEERKVITEDAVKEERVFLGKIRKIWKTSFTDVINFSENAKKMKTVSRTL